MARAVCGMAQLGQARAIVSRPFTQNRAWMSRRAKLIGKTGLIVLAPVAEAELLAPTRREKAVDPASAPRAAGPEWRFSVANKAKETAANGNLPIPMPRSFIP